MSRRESGNLAAQHDQDLQPDHSDQPHIRRSAVRRPDLLQAAPERPFDVVLSVPDQTPDLPNLATNRAETGVSMDAPLASVRPGPRPATQEHIPSASAPFPSARPASAPPVVSKPVPYAAAPAPGEPPPALTPAARSPAQAPPAAGADPTGTLSRTPVVRAAEPAPEQPAFRIGTIEVIVDPPAPATVRRQFRITPLTRSSHWFGLSQS
jgi:hypothetical protein